MNLKDLKVGDVAYLRRFSKHLCVESGNARVVIVKAIGTKYITIEHEDLKDMVKFHRDTGYERCDFEPDFKLYASQAAIEEDVERETHWVRLRRLDFRAAHSLPLDEYNRIMAILNNNQNSALNGAER